MPSSVATALRAPLAVANDPLLWSMPLSSSWATVSFAVPRDGWAEIWRRNYHELLSVPEAGEVCLWAGTNDAKQNRSLEQTMLACEAVLDQCRAAGRFVYLATLPGKRGFGAPREPWSMNGYIHHLNDAYRNIAAARGLALVATRAESASRFRRCRSLRISDACW